MQQAAADRGGIPSLTAAPRSCPGLPLEQLTAKDASAATFPDMQNDAAPLAALGVAHGDMVFLLYHFEREVAPAVQKSDWEKRPFGKHMDIEQMVAQQVGGGGGAAAFRYGCR